MNTTAQDVARVRRAYADAFKKEWEGINIPYAVLPPVMLTKKLMKSCRDEEEVIRKLLIMSSHRA